MKIFTKKSKGFTLIELLVVIAIIGILAGIVLINVRAARNKAKDAVIKSDMGSLLGTAEIYADDYDGHYTGVCESTDFNRIKTAIEVVSTTVNCFASSEEWATCAKLNAPTTETFWCIDSTGIAVEVDSFVCNGSITNCGTMHQHNECQGQGNCVPVAGSGGNACESGADCL